MEGKDDHLRHELDECQKCIAMLEQERADLIQQLDKAQAQAEHAEKQRRRFLSLVIHELRTPLTSIKGFTSTLLAPDVAWGADQQREFIGVIEEEAERLKELLNQLQEVSQIESGTLKIQAVCTEISQIIATAQAHLIALTTNHKLTFDLSNDLPVVMADPVRIAQVLSNLVGNAAKYSPPNTLINVTFEYDDEEVTVKVADQGLGIEPTNRQKVFEAYRQFVQGSQARGGGIGVGLAICKGIIDAHGGHIWIMDGQIKGTTVAFTLPIAESD